MPSGIISILQIAARCIACSVIAILGSASASSCPDIYAYKLNDGPLVDVFDVKEGRMHQHVPGAVEEDRFGGSIGFCSDEEYFCMIGRLAVAVPKHAEVARWQFKEVSCTVLQPGRSGEVQRMACDYRGFRTTFSYSFLRGIETYELDAQPGVRYTLDGEQGLFKDARCFP